MRVSVMRVALGAFVLLTGLPAAAQTPSGLELLVGHVPDPAAVGSDLAIELDVSNAGPGDATGVQLVVRFPNADAVLASAQAGQGSCSETALGEVTCELGTVGEGAAISSRVVVTPVTASTLTTFAEADSAEEAAAEGSDEVTVDGRTCDVVGTQGDDTLTAESAGQVVCGLGGNDALTGVDGAETLYGGTGNDILVGGAGDDELDGGDGRDLVSYADAAEGIRADLEEGVVTVGAERDSLMGIEDLVGSPYGDRIEGSAASNRLWGGGGQDLLFGGAGDDALFGEDGPDYLNGGPGLDDLHGGRGVDTCAVEQGTTASCQLDSPIDPDDTRGRLDVRRIRTAFDATTSRWRFVTHGRSTRRQLWDTGFALVFLDTSGDRSAEYLIVVRVRTSGRGMTAFLRRLGDGRQWKLEAWRPGWRSLAVELPMSRISIKEGREHFRWWGQTLFSHARCKKAVCFDVIPRSAPRGSLIQPVPEDEGA